jgi:hypothetical protein
MAGERALSLLLNKEYPLPSRLSKTKLSFAAGAVVAAIALANATSLAQGGPQIPVMDGAAGRCSLLLTVMADGKPVNAADVKVHIEYGFGGFRRLDLEAYTNAGGQLKFTGLPAKVHNPPLAFRGSKDQLSGIATFDPASECEGKHDLPLEKQSPQQ